MNYSLRQLLIFTAGIAITCACLAFASPVVGDLYYTAGLLTIAYAIIAAIYSRGTRRAFWVGFVICFAGYFGHTVWPSELRNTFLSLRRMGQFDYPAPDIITTRGLSAVYQGMYEAMTGSIPPRVTSPSQMMARNASAGQYLAFMTIGHCSFALVLGILGGVIARNFAARLLDQLKRSIGNLTT